MPGLVHVRLHRAPHDARLVERLVDVAPRHRREVVGIVGEVLHNYGRIRQLDVTASVSYDTDVARALSIVREALEANGKVLKDPAPVVRVVRMGECSVDIAIKPWVAVSDYGPAFGEVTQTVLEQFRRHGVQIPFPQREVRILGGTT